MRRQTEERMTRLVRAWRASGEPQARFARRHGVRPWTLWYWSQKVGRAAPRRTTSRPAFVPVEVVPDAAGRPPMAIEVVLTSGERLVVPDGVDGPRLRAVLAAVRAAC
jgi:transposase-like protein